MGLYKDGGFLQRRSALPRNSFVKVHLPVNGSGCLASCRYGVGTNM